MSNFGMSPERLRALLDRKGLRAPLTHVGGEAFSYLERLGSRYWLFHIEDLPRLGASSDTELGKGVIDFRRLLAGIDHIDDKFVFVEQETYPGAPLESARRDFIYLSTLEF